MTALRKSDKDSARKGNIRELFRLSMAQSRIANIEGPGWTGPYEFTALYSGMIGSGHLLGCFPVTLT